MIMKQKRIGDTGIQNTKNTIQNGVHIWVAKHGFNKYVQIQAKFNLIKGTVQFFTLKGLDRPKSGAVGKTY